MLWLSAIFVLFLTSCEEDEIISNPVPCLNNYIYSLPSDTIYEKYNQDYNLTGALLCIAKTDSTGRQVSDSVIYNIDFRKQAKYINDGITVVGKAVYDANGDLSQLSINEFCTISKSSSDAYNKVYCINKAGNNPKKYYLILGVKKPKGGGISVTVR